MKHAILMLYLLIPICPIVKGENAPLSDFQIWNIDVKKEGQ